MNEVFLFNYLFFCSLSDIPVNNYDHINLTKLRIERILIWRFLQYVNVYVSSFKICQSPNIWQNDVLETMQTIIGIFPKTMI